MNLRLARLSLYASVTLLVLGLAVTYLGYDGAATNTNIVRQIPYLVSGGFMGMILISISVAAFIGSVVLWALDGVRTSLSEVGTAVTQLTEALSRTVFDDSNHSDGTVSVLRGSSSYHLSNCRLVDKKTNVTLLPREEAERTGLLACRVCKP